MGYMTRKEQRFIDMLTPEFFNTQVKNFQTEDFHKIQNPVVVKAEIFDSIRTTKRTWYNSNLSEVISDLATDYMDNLASILGDAFVQLFVEKNETTIIDKEWFNEGKLFSALSDAKKRLKESWDKNDSRYHMDNIDWFQKKLKERLAEMMEEYKKASGNEVDKIT